jgi:hypothetical protein
VKCIEKAGGELVSKAIFVLTVSQQQQGEDDGHVIDNDN